MSSSLIDKYFGPFVSAGSIITGPIATLATMFLVYGIYCVVFGLSIQALFWHKTSIHKLYKGCSVALFVLATISVAVNTWGISQQALLCFHAATTKDYLPLIKYLVGQNGEFPYVLTTNIVSNLMNSIADVMLVHRCYVLFSYKKFILYPLASAAVVLNGLLLACTVGLVNGLGTRTKPLNYNVVVGTYKFENDLGPAIVAFQILLASMTGGRIWWISRQTAQPMGASTQPKYNYIVAIVVESSLLYVGFLLAGMVLQFVLDPATAGVAPFDITAVTPLISGFAPTLVIFCIGHARSGEGGQKTMSTFRATTELRVGQARRPISTLSLALAQTDIHLQLRIPPNAVDLQESEDSELSSSTTTFEKV